MPAEDGPRAAASASSPSPVTGCGSLARSGLGVSGRRKPRAMEVASAATTHRAGHHARGGPGVAGVRRASLFECSLHTVGPVFRGLLGGPAGRVQRLAAAAHATGEASANIARWYCPIIKEPASATPCRRGLAAHWRALGFRAEQHDTHPAFMAARARDPAGAGPAPLAHAPGTRPAARVSRLTADLCTWDRRRRWNSWRVEREGRRTSDP